MDKIGVKIGLNRAFKSSRESSVGFNTIKRKIPWDLWDLCEAQFISRGICVRLSSLALGFV